MNTEVEKRIIAELEPIDTAAIYNDMLDECYSFSSVGGIFENMSPSTVLKNCDITAYNCGCNDYMDSLVGELYTEEIDGNYYDLMEAQKIIDEVSIELEEKELTEVVG